MAGGRDAVRMSAEEVRSFLDSQMKVQVATLNADGSPHLTTLFYVVQDGRLVFWTYGKSQKIRNLERDPRISLLVEDGTDYFELRGVSLSGRAELVRDREAILTIGRAVAGRMAGGQDLGQFGEEIVQRQATKRVGVAVALDGDTEVASWDHRKMGAAS